ncbi:MAG: hypothetical protein [Bacteriophage sp.]|nr:MAG: hypothetical protein [Bacteriophage sp.]
MQLVEFLFELPLSYISVDDEVIENFSKDFSLTYEKFSVVFITTNTKYDFLTAEFIRKFKSYFLELSKKYNNNLLKAAFAFKFFQEIENQNDTPYKAMTCFNHTYTRNTQNYFQGALIASDNIGRDSTSNGLLVFIFILLNNNFEYLIKNFNEDFKFVYQCSEITDSSTKLSYDYLFNSLVNNRALSYEDLALINAAQVLVLKDTINIFANTFTEVPQKVLSPNSNFKIVNNCILSRNLQSGFRNWKGMVYNLSIYPLIIKSSSRYIMSITNLILSTSNNKIEDMVVTNTCNEIITDLFYLRMLATLQQIKKILNEPKRLGEFLRLFTLSIYELDIYKKTENRPCIYTVCNNDIYSLCKDEPLIPSIKYDSHCLNLNTYLPKICSKFISYHDKLLLENEYEEINNVLNDIYDIYKEMVYEKTNSMGIAYSNLLFEKSQESNAMLHGVDHDENRNELLDTIKSGIYYCPNFLDVVLGILLGSLFNLNQSFAATGDIVGNIKNSVKNNSHHIFKGNYEDKFYSTSNLIIDILKGKLDLYNSHPELILELKTEEFDLLSSLMSYSVNSSLNSNITLSFYKYLFSNMLTTNMIYYLSTFCNLDNDDEKAIIYLLSTVRFFQTEFNASYSILTTYNTQINQFEIILGILSLYSKAYYEEIFDLIYNFMKDRNPEFTSALLQVKNTIDTIYKLFEEYLVIIISNKEIRSQIKVLDDANVNYYSSVNKKDSNYFRTNEVILHDILIRDSININYIFSDISINNNIGGLSDTNPTSLFIKSIDNIPNNTVKIFLTDFKRNMYKRYLSILDDTEKLFDNKRNFYLENFQKETSFQVIDVNKELRKILNSSSNAYQIKVLQSLQQLELLCNSDTKNDTTLGDFISNVKETNNLMKKYIFLRDKTNKVDTSMSGSQITASQPQPHFSTTLDMVIGEDL